jgi:hypothetical protein
MNTPAEQAGDAGPLSRLVPEERVYRVDLLPAEGESILSPYVEHFWTPVIGPTALLLARLLYRKAAEALHPSRSDEHAFVTDLYLASCLGVAATTLHRSMERLEHFGVLSSGGPKNRILLIKDSLGRPSSRHVRGWHTTLGNELLDYDKAVAGCK